MKNRKIKLLVPFLAFVVLITLGMSGLYVDIFDSFEGFFEDETEENVLIVQKASAYSASSLSSAIETVGSVNILELTLGNDINYSGKTLSAGNLSVVGSSTFYLDVNGHDLNVENADEYGIFMEDSTFYAVDNVGSGNVKIESSYTGITCKNFVITSGSISVGAGIASSKNEVSSENEGYIEGPSIPEEYDSEHSLEEAKKIIFSENIDLEYLGAYDEWKPTGNSRLENSDATPENRDGVRAYTSATIGDGKNACRLQLFGAKYDGKEPGCNMAIQTSAAGLRIGNKSDVNDGILEVKKKGTLECWGSIGLFSNKIDVYGTVKAYGVSARILNCSNCGTKINGIANKCTNCKNTFTGGYYPGIYFSDPWGFDGYFAIHDTGTVYSSARGDKCGILSFGCDYFKIEGTLYSDCEAMYLDASGNLIATDEDFKDGDKTYTPEVRQISAICLDFGDLIVTGPKAKCFLKAKAKTVIVGQEAGQMSYNDNDKLYFQCIGSWFEWKLTDAGNGKTISAQCEHGYKYSKDDKLPWVGKTVADKLRGRVGTLSDIQNLFHQNRETLTKTNVTKTNFLMTHCSRFEASDGALMFVLAKRGTDSTASKGHQYATALYCSGGTGSGEDSCFQIRGGDNPSINKDGTKPDPTNNQTKIYLVSDHYGLYTEHSSVYISGNALVDINIIADPKRTDVPVSAVRTIGRSRYFKDNKYLGGNFILEHSAVLQCDMSVSSSATIKSPYATGIDIGNGLTIRYGATARINAVPTTDYYKSCGILAWDTTKIQAGSYVQVVAGSSALKQESGDLSISGTYTYCSFVSHGGNIWDDGGPTYGSKDIANIQYTDDDFEDGVQLNSNYGIISAGKNSGTVTIGGNKLTVICSYIDPYTKRTGKNQFEAGLNANKDVVIQDGSTFKCVNASTGIEGYNAITLSGDSNIQIENVEDGIRCESSNLMVNINSNSNVYVSADRDAISAKYGVNIQGNAKVSLKSNGTSNGAGIWVSDPPKDKNAVVIKLTSGYFSAYAPSANYGICVNKDVVSNISITASSNDCAVTCEGRLGGIATGGKVAINSNGKVNLYSKEGYGAYAGNTIDVKGSGNVFSTGKIYGLFAGKAGSDGTVASNSNGTINISGNVKVEANGTYDGSASKIKKVSFVSGSTTGTETIPIENLTMKKYDTLEDLANGLGGGFYATVTNMYRQSIVTAIGSYYNKTYTETNTETTVTTDSEVVSRVNFTGGPEEIWRFEYDTTKKMWTIQNYMTKQYISVDGTGKAGDRIVMKRKLDGTCYFTLKRPTKIYSNYGVSGNTTKPDDTYNQYVISPTNNKYCIGLNSNIGTDEKTLEKGEYGTQLYDNIDMKLDTKSEPNSNQAFSINPIADLGDLFKSTIKSNAESKQKYLDFLGKDQIKWLESGAPLFTFEKDLTERFPFSYEIYEDQSKIMDIQGGKKERGTVVRPYDSGHNGIDHRFRLIYSIGSFAGYTIMPVKTPWVVSRTKGEDKTFSSDDTLVTAYNRNLIETTFALESYGKDALSNTFEQKGNVAPKDSVVATSLYGKTVTYKIQLDGSDAYRFVLTGVSDMTENAMPKNWTLYECNKSPKTKIGKKVAEGTFSLASEKFNVSLKPSSSAINYYYLVVEANDNSKFVGIGEIGFYPEQTGISNSAGIAASNEVSISVKGEGKVKAIGQRYGILSKDAINIGTEDKNISASNAASKLTNVEAYGINSSFDDDGNQKGQGRGIVGKTITTKYCTVIAQGTRRGIESSSGNITIGDHSTIDAISNDDNVQAKGIYVYKPENSNPIKISPSASVYTSGYESFDESGNRTKGYIDPPPVSTIDGTTAYEVQFHYATVKDRDLSTRKYGEHYFQTNIYQNGKTPYSTLADNYKEFSSYLGVGHKYDNGYSSVNISVPYDKNCDYSLYIYLPKGDYINVVEAYNKGSSESVFSVNYAVAGYNRVENGELMFTAKYDMGDYNNLSGGNYVTSANVNNKRIDVYPLKSFYLETYRINVGSKTTALTSAQKEQLKNASALKGIYDNDDNYTWSEVKYFIENIAPKGTTVYIKADKNSLAFSTITVPEGVKVEMYGNAGSTTKVVRAIFDTSLIGDMDSIYEKTPSGGEYPLEGGYDKNSKPIKMLESYQNIKNYYSPSTDAYTSAKGYPTLKDVNNGLSLPLFHMKGDSTLNIDTTVELDNVSVGVSVSH